MSKKVTIKGLEDIDTSTGYRSIYAKINLYDDTYHRNGVAALADRLNRLRDFGFTEYTTSYEMGYYDSVESIYLEFTMDQPNNVKELIVLEDTKTK